MTNVRKLRPSELDLQAYLDDELEPTARLRVIEWLLENPKSAQELFEVQLREDLLRVAVKLSLIDEAPDENAIVRLGRRSEIDFKRYDRFVAGFAVAAVIFVSYLLMTAFV